MDLGAASQDGCRRQALPRGAQGKVLIGPRSQKGLDNLPSGLTALVPSCNPPRIDAKRGESLLTSRLAVPIQTSPSKTRPFRHPGRTLMSTLLHYNFTDLTIQLTCEHWNLEDRVTILFQKNQVESMDAI